LGKVVNCLHLSIKMKSVPFTSHAAIPAVPQQLLIRKHLKHNTANIQNPELEDEQKPITNHSPILTGLIIVILALVSDGKNGYSGLILDFEKGDIT
jgi:hypothetical protein